MPRSPDIDAVLITEALPVASRCGQAGRVVWKTMSSSTWSTWRQRSSVIWSNGANPAPAALL